MLYTHKDTLCVKKLFIVSCTRVRVRVWDVDKSAERGNVVNAIYVIRISDDNVMPTRVE